MTKQLQTDAINTAQALINLCKSMKDCSECPFAYWNDNYDKGIAHCTIGSPDEWDIDKASVKVEETERGEPKKIVPFDFSLKEDRDALIGRRIYSETDMQDMIVTSFVGLTDGIWQFAGRTSDRLFHDFVFADTGLPVGKEVKE